MGLIIITIWDILSLWWAMNSFNVSRFKKGDRVIVYHISGYGQKTIYGSWVTSLWRMEELVGRLARWNIHPEDLITHEFPLEKVGKVYSLMASGQCGKVAVTFE